MVRICRAGDQLSESQLARSCGEYGHITVFQPTLQNIKTDAAKLVDVGVKDLGQEADLGRCHGIVVRKKQFELEDATCSVL